MKIIVSQIKTAASVWCKKNPRAGLIIIISSHIPSTVSTGQLLLSIDEPVVSRSVYRTLLKRPSHGWPRVIPSGINWDAHGLENPPLAPLHCIQPTGSPYSRPPGSAGEKILREEAQATAVDFHDSAGALANKHLRTSPITTLTTRSSLGTDPNCSVS